MFENIANPTWHNIKIYKWTKWSQLSVICRSIQKEGMAHFAEGQEAGTVPLWKQPNS